MAESDIPTVSEFYRGRSVLMNGGTGFMGKVLLEKLLRSCPDIAIIYVIVRAKKGKLPSDRLAAIFDSPLFDRMKAEQPRAQDKVVAMEGDMMELGLGLNPEDRRVLEEEVSVVFNVAATVRFDDPIKSAVIMNVRGPREMLELACNMKQLKVFLHVSTCYTNTDRIELQEVVYHIGYDWKKMIRAVETLDEHHLRMITPKILGSRPNTYTYTKALGEHAVQEYGGRLPIVILRPSIVVSAIEEPVPGWGDSFNGPIGMMSALGKGFLRTLYADPDKAGDYIPVDLAIKSIIVAAWDKGVRTTGIGEVEVYNCATGKDKMITMGTLFSQGLRMSLEHPLNDIIWYPNATPTTSKTVYYFKAFFLHLLPALLIDALLLLAGKRTILLMLQRRVYIANMTLQYFWFHHWHFDHSRLEAMVTRILPHDREWKDWGHESFQDDVDLDKYFTVFFKGGRRYLLKEDLATLPRAKKHLKLMYRVNLVTKVLGGLLLGYFALQFASPVLHLVRRLFLALDQKYWNTVHRFY